MSLTARSIPPLIISSDAQSSVTSVFVAFLVLDLVTQIRVGKVWSFSDEDLAELSFADFPMADETRNPIAQAEAAAVATAFVYLRLEECDMIFGRSLVYWVDNASALHSIVKGGSKNPAINRACSSVHMCAYHAQCFPWFEYIASEANWSDGASRELLDDELSKAKCFSLSCIEFPAWAWSSSLEVVWRRLVDRKLEESQAGKCGTAVGNCSNGAHLWAYEASPGVACGLCHPAEDHY